MTEENNQNRTNDVEIAPENPPEQPPGEAAKQDAGPTEETPYRRREFLGIVAKIIVGAAVGLRAGANALANPGPTQQGGEGLAGVEPIQGPDPTPHEFAATNLCTTASPNTCSISNNCTGKTTNICEGTNANTCTISNKCDAGPRSGNECLGGANANNCNLTEANTCNGDGGLIAGNKCQGAGAANACTAGAGTYGNTCKGGANANWCREAAGANTCMGRGSWNICRADAANRCTLNGTANTCIDSGANTCSPTSYNTCVPADVVAMQPKKMEGQLATELASARVRDILGLFQMPVG